jgi:hypothetical protein
VSDTRFWAEWISGEKPNDFGEFDPDGVEYSRVQCRNLDEAKRVSIARGKAMNISEWARVTEEVFLPELNIPKRSDAAWDTVCLWYGDWQGNWDEDRS